MYYHDGILLSFVLAVAAILISVFVFRNLHGRRRSSAQKQSAQPEAKAPVSPGYEYEVFLSFRGTDTRTGFTDFLFHHLFDAGIRTFRDNEELRVGEEIGPELLRAIEQSKISIPIFSRDYASSKWCMKELVQMVKCMKTKGQKVFPIFYDVGPSDVRHQTGSYEKAFRLHTKSYGEEIIGEWKEALRVVGALKGWELKNIANGHQGELVKLVVSKVVKELKNAYLVLTNHLVGIDNHVEELMRLLDPDSSDVIIVGIHGMGGVGKTTIAKIIYNQLSDRFEHYCFLADIRETSLQHRGLENLQIQLISRILKWKCHDIMNVDEGINIIKDRFCNKKVLILLDDVDQRTQLNAVAGNRDWFGSGSRIIVTTRNKEVLNVPEVDWTYELKEMNSKQSLQLFSKHAFRSDYPPEDYAILSRDVVSTTGGLPLALEIIGSFLSGKGKALWEDTLKKLAKIPDAHVQKKLRISYEALDYEQKQIFLDIACFCMGTDKRIAVHMWDDCEFFPVNGIEVLLLMSLIKIGDDNELRMHDQLRDLGRQIVREENIKDPAKRSRLWFHKEALKILETNTGTTKIEALCLDFGSMSSYCFTNEELAKMSNLRFLQVDYADLSGDFKLLLSELRWLRWNGCPSYFLPTNFHIKKLVILDLSWSSVTENWNGWSEIKMAKNLKVLNFTGCIGLTKTPDFSEYATLERLILEECESLVFIDPSIGHLQSLVFLNVKNCAKLQKLPLEMGSMEALTELLIDGTSVQEVPVSRGFMKRLETISATCCGSLKQIPAAIGQLKSVSDLSFDFSSIAELPDSIGSLLKLRRLSLRYCLSLRELPKSIGGLESLIELRLFAARITEIPDTIGNLKNLKVLDIDCSHIRKFPEAIGMLEKLEEMHASQCYDLEGEVPSNIGGLSFLRILILDSSKICSLPASICGLSRLQEVDLIGCRNLHLLPEFPSSLTILRITCVEMWTFSNLLTLRNLMVLCFSFCYKLVEVPDIWKLYKLETLNFYTASISTLPIEIVDLPRLKELIIQDCGKLQYLPDLPPSLFKLCVEGCESLKMLPNLSKLKKLIELSLSGCSELREIQGIQGLEMLTRLDVSECSKLSKLDGLELLVSLRYLNVSWCESLERLPNISSLNKLRKLVTLNHKNLFDIPGLSELKSLEHLNMGGCISLEILPDLSKLEMLRELHLHDCEKLHDVDAFEKLKSIKWLNISGCKSVEKLPNLSNMKNLKELRAPNCEKLTEIGGLKELKSLELLDISGCKSLKTLPDLSNIKKVKH